jgi:hypothetical protein
MMSRNELLGLIEWWKSWGTQRLGTVDGSMADKTAALLSELLEQKPVAAVVVCTGPGVGTSHATPAKDYYTTPIATSDNYIATVSDECDRIVWRNRYYHLPLSTPIKSEGDRWEDARDTRDGFYETEECDTLDPFLEKLKKHIERVQTESHSFKLKWKSEVGSWKGRAEASEAKVKQLSGFLEDIAKTFAGSKLADRIDLILKELSCNQK